MRRRQKAEEEGTFGSNPIMYLKGEASPHEEGLIRL
jgi:hypothetical protein